jgi:hypothetical protein
MRWKVAAVLAAVMALLVGAAPAGARDLAPDGPAVASSGHDAAHGLLPGRAHAKRTHSLRHVVALAAAPFQLTPPTAHLVAPTPSFDGALPFVRRAATAIRAPPSA